MNNHILEEEARTSRFRKPLFGILPGARLLLLMIFFVATGHSSRAQVWSATQDYFGWFGDTPANTPNSSTQTAGINASASAMSGGAGITMNNITESSGGNTASFFQMQNVNSNSFASAVTNNDYIKNTITVGSGPKIRLTQFRTNGWAGASGGTFFLSMVVVDLATSVQTTVFQDLSVPTATSGASATLVTPYEMLPGKSYEVRWYVQTGSTTNVTRAIDNPILSFQAAIQGTIYVHKKTLNEESSVDFPFTATSSVSSPFSFTLNDQPGHVGAKDIGTDNTGKLWVIAEPYSSTVNSFSSTVDGAIYSRPSGSSSWTQLSGEVGSRIDGDLNGGAVYITAAGLVKSVTGAGTVTTLGSASGNFGNSLPVDIGSGQGQGIMVATANGNLYRYNSVNNWSLLTGSAITRVDVSPVDGKLAVVSGGNFFVGVISGTNVSYTSISGGINDVTIDDDGTITCLGGTTTYQFNGTALVADAGGFTSAFGITGGVNGQVWVAGNQSNTSPFGTILARTADGASYLDDERVRVGTKDNSEIITVTPGSYTLTESVPSGWALQNVELYDPTNNSTSSISGTNAVIDVAAGEVVHVVFQNGLVQPVAISADCSTPYTENFGTVVTGSYGPPLIGQTSLHYLGTNLSAGNGYYKMIGTTLGGRFATAYANGPLNEHTTNNLNDTGQMMVIDASYPRDEFYRRRLTGLVPGVTYNFSAWVANITNASIRPNVLFQVVNPVTGSPLATTSTGNITTNNVWQQYTLPFTATTTSIDIVLKNNNTGGAGNDLALDDISLSTTPPPAPTVAVTQQPDCATATGTITVSAPLGANYQYSINGVTYQSSPVFTGVAAGKVYAVTTKFASLSNCVSPAVSVTVNGASCPTPDSGTIAVGTTGTAIAAITANDLVNGVTPVLSGTSANATVTAVSTPAGLSLNVSTGAISVTAGTAPGSYTVVYQLCTLTSPVVCATTTATVLIRANVIANPDAGTANSGSGGRAVVNVTTNDMINGQPATLGSGGNATVASVGTYPVGITLNTNTGSVSVAAGTSPGSYTVTYQLCDMLTPANCTTTTAQITVVAPQAPISLTNICPATTVNLTTAVSATNLPPNTTLTFHTGFPATASNKIATPASVTGGSYYAAFEDAANNCYSPTSTTLTVTIVSCLSLTPDNGIVSAGTGGTAVTNVVANDQINGQPATLGTGGNTTLAQVGTYPAGITLNTATGSVGVAVGTTPGNYTVVYQLCDRLTPATCATTTVAITVTPSVITLPDAGTVSSGAGGTAVANVRTNDMVNGSPATSANSSLSLISSPNAGITFNTTTGSVSVAVGTAPGNYTLTYQLCSTIGSTTCTTSYAAITVTPSVTAAPDAGTVSSGTGGNAVADVRTNDLVNGVLPSTANSTLALVASQNAGITLNTVTGAVNVAVSTTPGTYTLTYQLCDKLTTPTCTTGLATITVTPSATANPDSGTASSGTGGTAVANVRTNDVVNGQPATPANSSLSLVSSQNPGITLNPSTGSVSVAVGTAPGTYTLTYQLCSTIGSTTCTTGLVSVTVTPSITASPDAGTALATGGTAIPDVTTNDVANGITPILSGTAANATLTTVSTAPGISLNPATGSVSVANGTSPGTYTLVYQICTIATPVVCATTTATVTVQGPDLIIAIGQPAPGLLVGQTSNLPVTVSNTGAVPTAGPVSFTLSIPASVTASASFTSNGFTCTTSGTLVSCSSSATITNGASTTVQVPITPLAASAGTSPAVSATVATANESNLNNNTATTTVGPVLAPDLTILIGQPSSALVVGQTSTIPVTVSNIGTAPSSGLVSFTLSVPASVTVPATFTSNGFGCVTSGTLVSCSSSATITNGASTTVLVPITPLPAATGTNPVLSATVVAANESNPNNNTATTTVTPAVVAPDLTISIGQPSPVLTIGVTSTVPVIVSNIGTAPTFGPVSFTLSIPASTSAPATFTSNGFGCTTSGTLVSCTSSATIVNGGTVTVSVPVTPTIIAVNPVFSATVITANESNPNNNTATITASAVVAPDLTVSINQPSPVLVAGQSSAVRITISNVGTATTLTPVSFTLSIPATVTAAASFTSNGFTCTTSGTLVSCSSSAAIASGTSTTLAIPITPLNAAVGTSPVLSGTVATTAESNTNNNTAVITVTTPVAGQPDLIVSIGQPSPNLIVGQVSSVPVSVSNIGTAPTSGPVTFTLSIPANVSASAMFTSNGFTCATSGTLVSCSSPTSITNGAGTTVLVPITPLAASTGTSPVLSATVATGNESNPNNNTATTTVATPVVAPDLIIAIGQPSPVLVVGLTSSLPVSLSNIGTAPTAGPVSFTLSIPASISASAAFTSNGFSCTTSGTLVSCTSSATITTGGSTTVLVPITPLTAAASTSQIVSATVATANESNINNNTATTTVTVSASVVATTDTGTASAGTSGTAVADVRTNDLVNGAPATSANSTLSLVSTTSPGITLNTTTGSVSVAQGTTPGSYTLVYQLCDKLTPTTCSTALAAVTVTASVTAGPDAGTASAGTGGTAVADVRTNDTVNGVASTSVNSTLSLVSTSPGITLNTTTGSVSVAQGTTPGSYTLVYQLCDKLTPTTCTTALAAVTVTASVTASPDAGTVSAGTGGTAVANVRTNDLVSGVAATSANSALYLVSSQNPGITLNTTTGSVSVTQGTTPGSYTLVYQLCDNLTSPTCATGLVAITVTTSVTAAPDAGTVSSGTGGMAVANVTTNDVVNGQPATLGTGGNSTIASVGTYPPGITLNTTTGSVSVTQGTTPGSYTVAYQLCDKLTSPTCTTGLAVITVTPSVTAAPDAGTVSAGTGGTAVASVTTNDVVNGQPATLGAGGNSTIASVGTYPTGISLNINTGSVSVAQGTIPGSYTVAYQLCDKLTTPTCTTGLAFVTVTPSVTAAPDAGTVSSGMGGTAVANVRTNDVVNGVPASTANSVLSLVGTYPAGITLNTTTGSISVAVGTAPGTYPLVYRLCDLLTPATCTTTTVTITVTPIVTASPDAGTISTGTGGVATNVRTNDIVNGIPASAANSVLSTVGTYPPGITLSTASGSVGVAPSTVPGTYVLVYQICDLLTPATCATATATITVTSSVTASPDAGTVSAGMGGTAVADVRNNDVVNGNPASGANSVLSVVSTVPGITLNLTTGAVNVAIGTTPGTYPLVYQLCDLLTPATCTTTTATITVTPSVTAGPDSGTVSSATGGTAVANVTTNDVVNGQPATLGGAGNATLVSVGTYPPGITLNPATGSVSVAQGTMPGSYTVAYQLCDKLTTPTCTTGLVTIMVTPSVLASPDAGTVSTGTGGVAVVNVTTNDVVNGQPAALGAGVNATIASVGIYPAGITLDVNMGSVSVAAGTPPGSYTVAYQLCDLLTPATCSTSFVGITVLGPDLIIAIGQPSPVLVVGQTSNVPVTVSNIGTSPTAGPVSFTLSIPANVSASAAFTSNGFSCSTSGTLVSCISSDIIANGASTTVLVPVTPLPAAAGTSPVISGTVATANETNPNNNTATTTATPAVVAPDLIISIGQPSPVLAVGQTSNVPVTVSNIGTSPTSGPVTFTLSIPASVTAPAAFNGNGFGCVTSGTLVTCTSSVILVAGDMTTVFVPITPTSVVANPVLSATVTTANESNVNNNTATTTISSAVAPDLIVSIGQPAPALVAGQTSSVAITVSNAGTAPTSGPVTFTLSIPSSVTAPAAFTSNGFSCTTSGTLVACTSPATIPNGASTTVQVPVTPLNAAVGTSPVLSVTVATANESNVNNNTAVSTVTIPVAGQPDLVIAIGQPSPGLVAGQTSNVPVTLTNMGTAPTLGPVSFTLSIPANVTAAAMFSSNGFSCTTSGTLVACSSPTSITNGAAVTVVVPVTALPAAAGTTPTLSATVATGNESNPNNNTTATTVTVSTSVVAAPDAGTVSAGTGGTAVADVRINDVVNGASATAANSALNVVGTYPAGITLNTTTGSVSVAQGTAPGSYTLVYQLCDLLTPATCTTTTAAITVTPSVTAAPDAGTVSAGTGGTAVANIRTNDVVNGIPASAANSVLSVVGTYPPGITLNTTTGLVSVAQGTTPGTYPLVYQLCDLLTPATCTTTTATITVTPSVTASPDAGTVSAGTGGTAVANVRINDVVNGAPAAAANSVLSVVGAYPAGITLNTNNGLVNVAQGTMPGTYTLVYQLCDRLTPATCTTTTATVTVTPSVTASPDAGTVSAGTGGTAVANVRINDVVNGVAATAANSALSVVGTYPVGITLNTTTGSVSVAQGTVPGSYTITYQLCDLLTPATCTTTTATITVMPSVTATPDAGSAGAATGGVAVASVTTNDVVNGKPATLGAGGNSIITSVGTYPPGITLNPATGSVSVAQGTMPGSYTVAYQLCDKLTSPTCSTATVTISVIAGSTAGPDAGTVSAGTGGTAVANVTTNDVVNGQPATLGTGGNSTIASVGTYPPGITLNTTTGSVSVTQGTTPGSYSLVYQLCDKLTTPTCTTGLAVITVTPSVTAAPDAGTVSSATGGTAVANVTTNDVVNGQPATLGAGGNATVASVGTYPTGITLNTTTGSVSVAVGTTPGSYSLVYQLCDKLTTPTCTTGLAVITVTPSVTATPDAGTVTAGPGGVAVANVATNDVVNGQPATLGAGGNATIASVGTYPPGITLNPATGSVSVAAGTTPGSYTVGYQLCDKLTSPTCATSVVRITVGSSLTTSPDAATVVGGFSVTIPILSNDTNPDGSDIVDLTKVTLPVVATSGPGSPTKGVVVVNPDGTVSYSANIGSSGVDVFSYTICDRLNPTMCSTALVSVSISANLSVALAPKVYLQGALFGVPLGNPLMRDDLRAKGYVPLSSPYGLMGLNGITPVGPTTSGVLSVTGATAVVDWVFVELRSPTSNTTVVDSRPALVLRNGDIVDVDGVSSLTFSVAQSGSYYVGVRHRNHLSVLSGGAIPLSYTTTVVDFRNPNTPTYNLDASNSINQAQVVVDQGVALWAGNTLYDRNVIYQGPANDVNVISQQVINASGNVFVNPSYKLRGYYMGDVNLNGETIFQGTGNDVDFIYQNITKNHPGNSLKQNSFKIREQLP